MTDNFSKSLDSLVARATKNGKMILYLAILNESKEQNKKSFTIDEISEIYQKVMGNEV